MRIKTNSLCLHNCLLIAAVASVYRYTLLVHFGLFEIDAYSMRIESNVIRSFKNIFWSQYFIEILCDNNEGEILATTDQTCKKKE